MKTLKLPCWRVQDYRPWEKKSNSLFITYPEAHMGYDLITCLDCGEVYAIAVTMEMYRGPLPEILSGISCRKCGANLGKSYAKYPDTYRGPNGEKITFERSRLIPGDKERVFVEFNTITDDDLPQARCPTADAEDVALPTTSGLRKGRRFIFVGRLAPGSQGNSSAGELRTFVESRLADLDFAVFDFSGLDYRHGDAIGGLWMTALARGVRCVVVVSAGNRSAFQGLVSNSVPVPLADSMAQGLELLRASADI